MDVAATKELGHIFSIKPCCQDEEKKMSRDCEHLEPQVANIQCHGAVRGKPGLAST